MARQGAVDPMNGMAQASSHSSDANRTSNPVLNPYGTYGRTEQALEPATAIESPTNMAAHRVIKPAYSINE